MRCNVCGMDYGMTHQCSGIAPQLTAEEAAPAPTGFSPVYYLDLAFRIVRWDDVAIRRASRDPNATYYGAVFWFIAATILFTAIIAPPRMRMASYTDVSTLGTMLAICFAVAYNGVFVFLQTGLCYVIAKLAFGGTGTYLAVMRPLLLGWFVNCLVIVPVVGLALAGIGWIAVVMMVFEEVDGIGRLQAFGISVGINVCFFVVQFMMTPATHHL
ncbi:MAG TPA: hypothetical protein VEI73_14335 [Candidatus Acidoferrum sp.]|nr:hypothetical protein [Candidatus Acidoferrum sp.]